MTAPSAGEVTARLGCTRRRACASTATSHTSPNRSGGNRPRRPSACRVTPPGSISTDSKMPDFSTSSTSGHRAGFGPGAWRPTKLYRRSAHEFSVSTPTRDYELAGRILARALAELATNASCGDALRDSALRRRASSQPASENVERRRIARRHRPASSSRPSCPDHRDSSTKSGPGTHRRDSSRGLGRCCVVIEAAPEQTEGRRRE
jgi:hypothetical protein